MKAANITRGGLLLLVKKRGGEMARVRAHNVISTIGCDWLLQGLRVEGFSEREIIVLAGEIFPGYFELESQI